MICTNCQRETHNWRKVWTPAGPVEGCPHCNHTSRQTDGILFTKFADQPEGPGFCMGYLSHNLEREVRDQKLYHDVAKNTWTPIPGRETRKKSFVVSGFR